jgi:hypothetical protein
LSVEWLALPKVEKTLEDPTEFQGYLDGVAGFEAARRADSEKKWEEKKKKGGGGLNTLASLSAGYLS